MNHARTNWLGKTAQRLTTCIAILLAAQVVTRSHATQLDEDDAFRAGLIARYSDGDGKSIERIDSRVSFVWNGEAPDPRVGAKAFKAAWSGYLMTQSRGEYAVSVYAAGRVRIKLGGEVILDKQTDTPAWLDAKAVELPFDWHPLEIRFEPTGSDARISLFWKGPGFQLEPIAERWLYHDREKSLSQGFQKGQTLVRALRCGACHTVPGHPEALSAQALDRLAGNVSSKWLVDWLSEDTTDRDAKRSGQVDPSLSRRMPHFGLSREDAECISKYLLYQSRTSDKTKPVKSKTKVKTDLKAGETLLLTTGCLACHQFEGLGTTGLFDGGDLSGIADKRPKEFFATWLSAPEKLNRRHRMPVFSLTTQERHNLTEFLATCKTKDANDFAPPKLRENDPGVAKGRQLFAKHRCNACHEISRDALLTDPIQRIRIARSSDWKQSCVAGDGQQPGQPRYHLDTSSRTNIETYFAAMDQVTLATSNVIPARQLLVENNCLACHARGLDDGLSSTALEVAKTHRQFESIVPAMIPPSLNSVGDKLHDKALAETIGRKGGLHRPWLNVRMPNFALSDDELKRLVQHFVDMDRIPERAARSTLATLSDAELQLAGARLVTAAGFGCTSCHRVGEVEPPAAPLNTRGPNLSQFGKRIRREWYDRWVRDPARIVPKMEMPSVQLAVRGVLDDQLDEQLDAVWHALNRPGFQPPTPNPVRVVRRSGLPERNESAAILTDVIQVQGQTFVKPFIVGLPNRHNVMIDLAMNRVAGWWIGDVARQRTKGKTWFWESGGTELFQAAPQTTELTLEFDGKEVNPHTNGQFLTEADQWRQLSAGIELQHRIRFQLQEESRPSNATLKVSQQFQNLPSDSESSGFTRRIVLRDVPAGASPIIQIVDASQLAKNSITGDKRSVKLTSRSRIEITKPEAVTFTDAGAIRLGAPPASGELELVLRYHTTLPVDKFPIETPPTVSPPPEELAVVPGFEAIRLPIADEWMPTGLAWRPDGTLVVTSLKGRVWLARDSDGDGLEDEVAPFSDDLAAPYGVAAYEDYIDVVNKYALLRLFDDDGDCRADRTVTVASGWGHTTDYHDWVVGLPSDEAGNYYIAIPCQQDDRSEAAALLHGKVISLVKRSPTADDPQVFSLKPISGGHRFPMGLARQRDGELFVTDNQGNYNPFNELNHVRLGARYGFINKLERKEGFAPELTRPAINIPHPWTRSVNGICFLYTPQQVKERTGRDRFGPFEGHLVGCEYDTRRLIRMSLQKVGDTYQGAAYPFSFDKPKEGPSLLGPLICAVAPRGDLYVGSIRDSGWGGANNLGSIVRIKPLVGKLPPGIAEVRARRDGFEIDFTTPVDVEQAMSKSSYSVSSYTRVSTLAYGGSDKDRRSETIHKIEMTNSGRGVRLHLHELRAGFVYEFRLKNLATGEEIFFPDEAFYTLNQIPR